MPEPRIEATNVGFYYDPRTPVLRGLSFIISAGDVLKVCGPNGTGKTTLLRLIAGTMSPRTGTVSTTGKLAYVPSDLAFHEALTVREEAKYLCSAGTIPPKSMQSTLTAWEFQDSHMGTELRDLSRGWRARFALAVADAVEPQLLLLDEPFANLDASGRTLATNLISRVVTRGAVVVVDHGDQLMAQDGWNVDEFSLTELVS